MFVKPISINVVGTAQDDIQHRLLYIRTAAARGAKIGFQLKRVKEADEFGPNSIKVKAVVNGTFMNVGYIPGNKAFWMAPKLDAGQPIFVTGHQVTGTMRGEYKMGLNIKVTYDLDAATAVVPAIEA